MNLRSVEFLIQEAFTGIRRNGLMAFASISTIALSLSVLGAFFLAALGANNFAAEQIGKFHIAVFTKSSDKAEANYVEKRILATKGVQSIEVRDRDREWANLKRERADFEFGGVRGSRGNPLPYTLDVKVSNPDRTSVIADKIRTYQGVDKVRDARDDLGRVMTIARVVRAISYTGVLILLVTTVFIISNAIKLTLYARRREIRIMQLVGATNWFIRVPLVIEGVVLGAVGALAAWVILRLGSIYLAHLVSNAARFLTAFSSQVEPNQLAVWLVLLGALIGAAGSFVSIRRFLRD